LNQEFKKIKEVEKILKKIELLNRKKEKMGLTEEEEQRLFSLNDYYYHSSQKGVQEVIDLLLSMIMNKSAKNSLKKIQKIIDWDGKYIIEEENLKSLLEETSRLSESQKKVIEDELINLHAQIFISFESFYNKSFFSFLLNDLGKMIINNSYGNIVDVVRYIDDIYRDLASMIGCELVEVEIDFEK
jgi:hypothetical protein